MAIAVTVKGKNMAVTEGLKAYAEKRLQKLEKQFPALREAVVRECVERNQHRVEVTLEGDGVVLRGEERSDNMYASVDLVLDKLEQRVRKFKARRSHHDHHDQSLRNSVPDNPDVLFKEILPAESEPEEWRPHIARTKYVSMKPMSSGDAAQMMEWLDHTFYVFLDSQTDQISVIYRRRDGNYGVIMPENCQLQ